MIKVKALPDGANSGELAMEYYRSRSSLIRNRLKFYTKTNNVRLQPAIDYFLAREGKYLRALLCLLACESAGGAPLQAQDYACGVELVHASSLIFDDLPCMDNALTRRGQQCLHLKFSEAEAILVAIHLLTKSFSIISAADSRCCRAVEIISNAVVNDGMTSGQVLDLFSTHDSDAVRNRKTTPLIVAAVQLGLHAAGTENARMEECLIDYAHRFSLAFQLHDDVVDGECNPALQQRAENIAHTASRDILAFLGNTRPAA